MDSQVHVTHPFAATGFAVGENGGSSRDGVVDRFRRPNDSDDHHKYYEEKDDSEIYFEKEDNRMRDGHREHRHSAKDERMKDRASHGSGRSSRRDDDDDRHIREQEGRKTKDDGYRDRQSAKGASKEGESSQQQFIIFSNKILPPDKQQSVPGRDTGES